MNRALRSTIVLLITSLFLVMLFSSVAWAEEAPEQTETSSRLDYVCENFEDDLETKTLTFSDSGYKLTHVKLPGSSKILDATMDIHGKPVYTASDNFNLKTYADTSDKTAYWGRNSTSDLPPKNSPGKLIGWSTQFSSGQYANIAVNNSAGVYHEASSQYSGNPAYHLFKMRVNKAQTSHMYILWKGNGYHNTYQYYKQTIYMAVWHGGANGWIQFGQVKCDSGSQATNYYLTADVDRAYLEDNELYICVWSKETQYSYGYYQALTTRYIEVKAYDRDPNYPTNPTIDVGYDGYNDWEHTGGELSTKKTFQGSKFINALQAAVDLVDEGETEVEIRTGTASMGEFYFSNLTINYKYNEVPILQNLPPMLQIFEDAGKVTTEFDLSDPLFLYDDNGYENLDIEFVGSDEETVEFGVDSQGFMTVEPAPNFYGSVQYKIRVTDWGLDDIPGSGDDVVVESPDLTIWVIETNDAPKVISCNGKDILSTDIVMLEGAEGATEDSRFNLTFEVIEEDGDDLYVTTNFTNRRFKVDRDTGDSYFEPTQADVGKHWIGMTFEEVNQSATEVLSHEITLVLDVANVNDNPTVTKVALEDGTDVTFSGGVAELTIPEDTTLNWTVKMADPDGDDVSFSSNYTNARFSYDGWDGTCSFSPIQTDVGVHWIGLTLDDSLGGSNEYSIKVTVTAVNDGPTARPITFTNDGLNVTFTTTAGIDPDNTELLYIWDFGDRSDTALGMEVWHIFPSEGIYTVTLTVSDTQLTDKVTVEVNLTGEANTGGGGGGGGSGGGGGTGGGGTGGGDWNTTNNEAEGDNSMMITAIVIIVVVVMLLAVIGVIVGVVVKTQMSGDFGVDAPPDKKKSKPKTDKPATTQNPAQAAPQPATTQAAGPVQQQPQQGYQTAQPAQQPAQTGPYQQPPQ